MAGVRAFDALASGQVKQALASLGDGGVESHLPVLLRLLKQADEGQVCVVGL